MHGVAIISRHQESQSILETPGLACARFSQVLGETVSGIAY
jgi:hypothetical protein